MRKEMEEKTRNEITKSVEIEYFENKKGRKIK